MKSFVQSVTARRHGISQSVVSEIKRGRAWNHSYQKEPV